MSSIRFNPTSASTPPAKLNHPQASPFKENNIKFHLGGQYLDNFTPDGIEKFIRENQTFKNKISPEEVQAFVQKVAQQATEMNGFAFNLADPELGLLKNDGIGLDHIKGGFDVEYTLAPPPKEGAANQEVSFIDAVKVSFDFDKPKAADVEPKAVDFDKAAEADPKAVEADPKAVEADPKAVEADPKAVEADPKAVEADPKSVEADPKSVEADPKSVEADPKAVEADPKAVEADPKAVEADPKAVEADPKAVEADPKAVEADPKAVEADPKAVEADPKAVEADPKAVEADPKAVEADPKAVEADPKAVEADPKAVEADPKAADLPMPGIEAAPDDDTFKGMNIADKTEALVNASEEDRNKLIALLSADEKTKVKAHAEETIKKLSESSVGLINRQAYIDRNKSLVQALGGAPTPDSPAPAEGPSDVKDSPASSQANYLTREGEPIIIDGLRITLDSFKNLDARTQFKVLMKVDSPVKIDGKNVNILEELLTNVIPNAENNPSGAKSRRAEIRQMATGVVQSYQAAMSSSETKASVEALGGSVGHLPLTSSSTGASSVKSPYTQAEAQRALEIIQIIDRLDGPASADNAASNKPVKKMYNASELNQEGRFTYQIRPGQTPLDIAKTVLNDPGGLARVDEIFELNPGLKTYLVTRNPNAQNLHNEPINSTDEIMEIILSRTPLNSDPVKDSKPQDSAPSSPGVVNGEKPAAS